MRFKRLGKVAMALALLAGLIPLSGCPRIILDEDAAEELADAWEDRWDDCDSCDDGGWFWFEDVFYPDYYYYEEYYYDEYYYDEYYDEDCWWWGC